MSYLLAAVVSAVVFATVVLPELEAARERIEAVATILAGLC